MGRGESMEGFAGLGKEFEFISGAMRSHWSALTGRSWF